MVNVYSRIRADAELLPPRLRHATHVIGQWSAEPNGHRVSTGNWAAKQIQHVCDHCLALTLTEAKDVLDMMQQHLIQMVSDLWDSRACLVSGKQPKTRTRHFRKGGTFHVVPEGRGKGIHMARLQNAA